MGSAVHRFFPPGSTDRLPRLNFPEAARGSARTEADSEAGPPVLEPARRVGRPDLEVDLEPARPQQRPPPDPQHADGQRRLLVLRGEAARNGSRLSRTPRMQERDARSGALLGRASLASAPRR